MHYEVITDKQIYTYQNYSSAKRMYDFLVNSGIKSVLKTVYKKPVFRR